MPAQVASSSGASSTRSKPSTRSSIRQSFGLSSVGKALADVMHKESKENEREREKATKKKDTAARRSSAINLAPPTRPSTDKPPAHRADSPDAKTITRQSRRQSALRKLAPPPDEQSSSPSDSASPKGSISTRGSLRNRNSLVGSGLPKYRPRSLLVGSAVAPSKKSTSPTPTHLSRRQQQSSSEDETDEVKTPKDSLDIAARDKSARSISPVPHPGALKVNLTSAINVRPATPERKGKDKGLPQPKGSPSSVRTASSKASKLSKTSTPPISGSGSVRSGLARPPSSASSLSGSSRTPNTPPTPTLFGDVLKGSNSLRLNKIPSSGTPGRNDLPAFPESPLGRVSARKNGSSKSGIIHMRGASVPATPSRVSEGSSMDSIDADDVEFMLGSVVSPSAPTPAVPRIVRMKDDDSYGDPHTPSRPGFLPSRANLSYASPAPPSADGSPFLRPKPRQPGNDRGSILSWEQLAKHSKTLDDEDVERMISEIPAPFRAGAISPSLSVIDIPDSPNLSALPSPTGYGSISQVLLPDVTPSPAIHNTTHLFDDLKPETPTAADSGAVTLVRLQLAAAENRAQERLQQMQSLEEQLFAAKAARLRDAEELAKQIAELEQQVHGNLLVESQRSEQIAVLEEMLRDAQSVQDKSIKDAARKAEDAVCASKAAVLQARQVQAKSEITLAARDAGTAWFRVRDTADSELELVRANREMLSLLLAGLDHSLTQLSCCK